MNRQSDVIENWEYGLLTLLNNALNLPVSEKNDAIEVKSIIEDVSRKLDSDSIQKFNEYSEDEWNKIIKRFYNVPLFVLDTDFHFCNFFGVARLHDLAVFVIDFW